MWQQVQTMCVLRLAVIVASTVALQPPAARRPPRARSMGLRGGGAGSEESPVARRSVSRAFAALAVPALVGLAIEPVASLVDTAYVGRRCGEAPLAGVGVAVSIFNILAKSCNYLMSATCSFVARSRASDAAPGEFDDESAALGTAAVAVAVGSGVALCGALRLGGPWAVRSLLGAQGDGAVHECAVAYLMRRAWSRAGKGCDIGQLQRLLSRSFSARFG